MTAVVVKYGGSTIADVENFECTSGLDYKGDATFTVQNERNENIDTWKDRRFGEKITVFLSGGTTLIWSGRIVNIGSGHPLQITCMGIMEDLEHTVADELKGKMIVDSLRVPNDPPGAAGNWTPTDENLRVVDDEDADPGLANDLYNSPNPDRYAIISDDTKKENTATLLSEAGTITGGAAQGGTTHADTQALDDTEYEITVTDLTNDPLKVIIDLDVENDNIAITGEITKIGIRIASRYQFQTGFGGTPFTIFTIGWSKDQTNIAPECYEHKWLVPSPKIGTGTITDKIIDIEIPILTDKDDDWFDNAAGEFTLGSLIFEIDQVTNDFNRASLWNIDWIEVKVYYSTGTFETQNRMISDTLNDVGGLYDVIQLWNDARDGDYNLLNKSINSGDRVDIAIGVPEALNRLELEDMSLEVNNGTDPKIGVTQDYVGITDYIILAQISKQLNYRYFIDRYTGYDVPKTLDPADITWDEFSGDTVASVVANVIEMTDNTALENAMYGTGDWQFVVTAGDQIGETYTVITNNATGFFSLTSSPNANLAGDTVTLRATPIVYSKDVDPPTWNSNIQYSNDEWGFVVVQYGNGELTGKIAADTPSTNPRTKLEEAKWILTRAEAEAYGLKRANYYATERVSIQVSWQYEPTNYPFVGRTYSFTDLQWDGAALVNFAFSDLVCRRVSVQWAGGLSGIIITAWMGLGQTPPDEEQALWEGGIDRSLRITAGLAGTARFTEITRHNQLLGIGTSDHHTATVRYTDAEVDAILAVHTAIEAAHGMEMDDLTDIDTGLSTVVKSTEETSAGAYPHIGTEVEGELHWDADENTLYRWNATAGAWIDLSGSAGLVGGNSAFVAKSDMIISPNIVTHSGADQKWEGHPKIFFDDDTDWASFSFIAPAGISATPTFHMVYSWSSAIDSTCPFKYQSAVAGEEFATTTSTTITIVGTVDANKVRVATKALAGVTAADTIGVTVYGNALITDMWIENAWLTI